MNERRLQHIKSILALVCFGPNAPETDMANGTSDIGNMPLVFRGALSKNFPTLRAL
jgi:hypothetical protein